MGQLITYLRRAINPEVWLNTYDERWHHLDSHLLINQILSKIIFGKI
jgi:hypothetical protein